MNTFQARPRNAACPAKLGFAWTFTCLCAVGFFGTISIASLWAAPAGTSLVRNGDFEQADRSNPAQPAFWDKPDGLGVRWTTAPKGPDGRRHGRAIRMDTSISERAMVAQWRLQGITKWQIPKPGSNPIAETYGLSFYSAPISVKRGQPYRITFDFKGRSGGAKVWVRGWGMYRGQKRRRWETTVECRVASGEWTTISQEFFPTKYRPEVTEMRVMLYAFYPPGVYWFDNVRIEPITVEEYEAARRQPAPAAHGRKPRRR